MNTADQEEDRSAFLHRVMRMSLMSKVGPARGVPVELEAAIVDRPRLTNEGPARVFHQGPQLRLGNEPRCTNDRL